MKILLLVFMLALVFVSSQREREFIPLKDYTSNSFKSIIFTFGKEELSFKGTCSLM